MDKKSEVEDMKRREFEERLQNIGYNSGAIKTN